MTLVRVPEPANALRHAPKSLQQILCDTHQSHCSECFATRKVIFIPKNLNNGFIGIGCIILPRDEFY